MKRTALTATALLLCILTAPGEEKKPISPGPNKADEAKSKEFSFDKGAEFLDSVSSSWTSNRKCATCHTNVPHLFASAVLKRKDSAAEKEVRKFFEERAKNWTPGKKAVPDENRTADAVVLAAALAMHDAGTTGKLHPATKTALDRIWTIQQKDGSWNWIKCNWPPLEHDDYYGAVLAAIGVGSAPEGYAKSDGAKAGLAKLKGYLQKTPAPTLHHKLLLVWASMKLDGLMTKEDREKTIKELLAKQKEDGGWSLPSLGDWEGYDGRANDLTAPSDGYATGLAVFVLRQSGVAAKDKSVAKGITWLKSNQRVSGRWFTKSLNTDRAHYISHAGTAYALMAIKSCE